MHLLSPSYCCSVPRVYFSVTSESKPQAKIYKVVLSGFEFPHFVVAFLLFSRQRKILLPKVNSKHTYIQYRTIISNKYTGLRRLPISFQLDSHLRIYISGYQTLECVDYKLPKYFIQLLC